MNKRALILIVILLILLGAGFYFFYMKGGLPSTQAIRDFLPFGSNNTTSKDTGLSTTTGDTANQPVDFGTNNSGAPAVLREISSNPVAGYTVFDKTLTSIVNKKKVARTETDIRYIERGTGNVFETKIDSTNLARLTNTTYPKIQEAFFTNSGNSVVIRSLGEADTIKTYLADVIAPPKQGTSSDTEVVGSLRGDYIDDNISFIATSPDTLHMFVLRENMVGANGFIADGKAGKSALIFSSKLGEWLPAWYSNSDIALSSKATGGIPGLVMLVHSKTGTSERMLSGIPGLTASVNPLGSRALYSQSDDRGSLSLNVYSKKSDTSTTTDRVTLPEKCVWSKKSDTTIYCLVPQTIPRGMYPDSWYQGVTSFSDDLWKLDVATGRLYIITQLSTAGRDIDGIRPTLTSDEKYILFINKKDGSLWSYQLVS